MKKIILTLVFIATTLASCSSSDDSEQTNKIVGSWKQVASTSQEGVNGTPENNQDNCATESTMVFTQTSSITGNVSGIGYYYNVETGNCVSSGQYSRTWTDLGSNTYTSDSPDPINIIFSNNNKTMKMTVNDGPYIIKTTYSKQ